MTTIRQDIEAVLAKARLAQGEAKAAFEKATQDEFQDANRKLLACMDVVKDLERALHNFSDRPGRGGNADYLSGV